MLNLHTTHLPLVLIERSYLTKYRGWGYGLASLVEAIIDDRGLHGSEGYAYCVEEGGGSSCVGGIRGRGG